MICYPLCFGVMVVTYCSSEWWYKTADHIIRKQKENSVGGTGNPQSPSKDLLPMTSEPRTNPYPKSFPTTCSIILGTKLLVRGILENV
jgi:hypothetical protein